MGLVGCGCELRWSRGRNAARRRLSRQATVPVSPAAQNPSSPSQAFLDGYRAYQNHDLATAIERLGYASEHFPRLADYALYYRGLAQRDSGDLAASAATFETLIRNYSESVTIAPAEVALSDVYLRLTRASDAAAAASRAIARTYDTKIEQSARLALARALAAEDDARGAYHELMTLRAAYPRGIHDAEARSFAYSILATNPEVANVNSVEHHRDEAALLLREGQPSIALAGNRRRTRDDAADRVARGICLHEGAGARSRIRSRPRRHTCNICASRRLGHRRQQRLRHSR